VQADYSYGPRRQIFYPLLGDGIFTQDGAPWKHSRELLRPQFSRNQYRDLEVFREHVDDLVACISTAGEPVDLQPLFFRFTLDTTTAFLFGESVYSLRADRSLDETSFAEAFNIAQEYLAKRYLLSDLYWLIGGRKFKNACTAVHKFVDDIIERGLQMSSDAGHGNVDRYVFLDVVAQDSSNRLALRHQLINILLAGRDTTACLLSWTL